MTDTATPAKQHPEADLSDEAVLRVWSSWLDGNSVNRIVQYEILSRTVVRRVLDEDPPQEIKDDPRYVHGGRFFWISAEGLHRGNGRTDPFVVVKSPRTYTGDVFQKALRAIRREIRKAGGDLNLSVLEGEDAATLLRFITEKGFHGFQFDDEGNIERFDPTDFQKPHNATVMP